MNEDHNSPTQPDNRQTTGDQQDNWHAAGNQPAAGDAQGNPGSSSGQGWQQASSAGQYYQDGTGPAPTNPSGAPGAQPQGGAGTSYGAGTQYSTDQPSPGTYATGTYGTVTTPSPGMGRSDIPHAAVVEKKKRNEKFWPTLLAGIIGVALGLAVGAGIVFHIASSSLDSSAATSATVQDEDVTPTATTISVSGEDVTLAEAVASKCMDSVVYIQSTVSGYGQSYAAGGSGVIVTEDGYIITNYHIIEGASTVTVTTNDDVTYDAQIVGYDQSSDIAVLKIDATGLVPMEIGSSSDLKTGEWCMTIGYPFGEDNSVAAGIISGLSRSTALSLDGSGSGQTTIYANLIQTDASINPGNSGGALVDSEGKLIGICALYESSTSSSANVGYAIPIDYVWRISNQIINGETVTHAYLGCSFSTIDSYTASRYNLPVDSGAYVNEVYAGTAADEAGIKSGDIIVAVNDEKILSSSELIIAIRSYNPGDQVTVTFNRGGTEQTVDVTFGSDEGASATTGNSQDTESGNQTGMP